MNQFKLSRRSLERMQGVHPDLVKVVLLAIQLTDADFGVTEGVRTIEKQREYFAKGASQTMNSRHITGHAVDLVAYVGREVRWDWPLFHKIAAAMKQAASALGVQIVWGGVWDREMSDLTEDMDSETAAYVARRKVLGKKAFIDGPHFELSRRLYP